MSKIGLIAGEGRLPEEFVKSVKQSGDELVVVALKGIASEKLNCLADRVYWLNIGQYAKFVFIILKERLRKVALLGKVPKQLVYEDQSYEKKAQDLLKEVPDNKDYSLLSEITKHFSRFGVEVIDPRDRLKHIIPQKGLLTGEEASDEVTSDIEFGGEVANRLAGLDIGQTVVVKKRAVVSVEAMEGTDEVIRRSQKVAGDGCVMVKLSRPDQDMRWDIPVIGERTIKNLISCKFRALAIESEKMFFLDQDELLDLSRKNGLHIRAI